MSPLASVLVLVLSVDEAELLESCLPAALAQDGARVVVIDNACTDATRDVCARLGFEVVALPARVSYAAAVNAGLAGASFAEDALLLLNADCVLGEGFLAAMGAALAAGGPGVGSVAPRLIRATGAEVHERLDVLDTAAMVVDRRRKNGLIGHGTPASGYASGGAVFGGDGACVLYTRAAVRACLGGGEELLDEDMELWASDVDLAWRAQLLGFSAVYAPDAVGWHQRFYSPTTRAALPEHHRRLQYRNRFLMMLKNDTAAGLLRDLPVILAWEVIALGHVLLRERHLLGGYADAWRLREGALRRRRALQPRRDRARRVPFGLRPPP